MNGGVADGSQEGRPEDEWQETKHQGVAYQISKAVVLSVHTMYAVEILI